MFYWQIKNEIKEVMLVMLDIDLNELKAQLKAELEAELKAAIKSELEGEQELEMK